MRRIPPLVLVLLLSFPAYAGDAMPAVGVLDVRAVNSSDEPAAAAARDALAEGLSRFRVEVLQSHPALVAAKGSGREAELAAGLEKARALGREGTKLYEKQDSKGAEAAFRAAAGLFESNAAGLASPDDLVGSYLKLARIFFATQRDSQAREIFRRIVQLDPDLVLDRAVYPDTFVKAFEGVRESILTGPQGRLMVIARPGPAIVHLDGRKRGTAPLELVNITPGVHALAVTRPGFAPYYRPIDVTSFRVDTYTAMMQPDRHPDLLKIFDPAGVKEKDAAGATLEDYIAAIAEAASLDLLFVGRMEKPGFLQVRSWHRATRKLSPVVELAIPLHANVLDEAASSLLEAAAARGEISTFAARRREEFGGGVFDPSRPWAARVSIAPAFTVQNAGRNVPDAPIAGFRIGVDRRLGKRVIASVMTGLDGVNDGKIVLEDDAGPLAPQAGSVGALMISVPLEFSARGYALVGTWGPFVSAGAGVSYDAIQWREGLPEDHVSSDSGVGFSGFAGIGLDRALDPRSAVQVEVRYQAGTLGAGDGTVSVSNQPSRVFPVGGETYGGVRLTLGYLRTF